METLLIWKAAIIGVWLAGFFVMERFWPAAPTGHGPRRIVSNIGLWLINIAASPFIIVPIVLFASANALDWRPEWWSGAHGLVLDILILDLWIYWWHRANHEIKFLWRFHEVHHLDQTLDATTAIRFHFGEVLNSSIVRAIVIIIIGIPPMSVLIFETMVLAGAIFHHSNIKLPASFERVLSWFVVTPSIHWVHHHAVRHDTDSNYATLLSIWDPIFGTRSKTQRTPDLKIGVENRLEKSLPLLLIHPALKQDAEMPTRPSSNRNS